ncbi:MAG: hypothetical protein AAF770_03350, partial [Bacteroidota bacterium]
MKKSNALFGILAFSMASLFAATQNDQMVGVTFWMKKGSVPFEKISDVKTLNEMKANPTKSNYFKKELKLKKDDLINTYISLRQQNIDPLDLDIIKFNNEGSIDKNNPTFFSSEAAGDYALVKKKSAKTSIQVTLSNGTKELKKFAKVGIYDDTHFGELLHHCLYNYEKKIDESRLQNISFKYKDKDGKDVELKGDNFRPDMIIKNKYDFLTHKKECTFIVRELDSDKKGAFLSFLSFLTSRWGIATIVVVILGIVAVATFRMW